MRYKTAFVSIALMILAALVIFQFFERRLSELWIDLALHPEVRDLLAHSAEDQKTLSRLDPGQAAAYRDRFEHTQRIRQNLFILENNRKEMAGRYRYALWSVFALVVLAAAAIQWRTGKRMDRRLAALRGPIEALAEGRSDIRAGIPGNDAIARIGAMIEKASHVFGRQKEQIRYLRHLSTWQEASRRHAHEMRTPLTAAHLELDRLQEMAEDMSLPFRETLSAGADSIRQELDRLRQFTHQFTAFARIRQPQKEDVDLGALLTEFSRQFHNAWPGMKLNYLPAEKPMRVLADPEMLRQVLVNLCSNSAKALDGAPGSVTFELSLERREACLRVADDGPGIEASVRESIFDPYITTGKIGESMGLGLPIARKIMLDQGGELALVGNSAKGAHFLITLPLI